jgi:hypothetical protein
MEETNPSLPQSINGFGHREIKYKELEKLMHCL